MPDRRRQRQQRVRHDPGGSQNPVGASNRGEPPPGTATPEVRERKQGGTGVAYAEPRQYESVTVMPDKEPAAEPQKYRRREVLSNWLRYEDLPHDEPEEGEDYLIGEDFSQILDQQAGCSGGHLRLKNESLWEEEEASLLTSHGLGALHIADLVAAINTLPLYTQVNIPEDLLPESVVDYYTQLADDNRKLYQPTTGYQSSQEINDKILESLKMSDNEPLNLTSEEPEPSHSAKNAVDVALSLSNAFVPEPEDVDLESLMIQEPVKEKQPSPVRRISPEKQPNPVRAASAEKQPCVKKSPSPDKVVCSPSVEPVRQSSPPQEGQSQPKGAGGDPQSVNSRTDKKEKSPASFDFGLKKKEACEPQTSQAFNFGLPKVDISSQKTESVKEGVKVVLDPADPLKLQDQAEEEPQTPAVDLDAPVQQSKPVLLISQTEADDLEDWLDSVLDD